jgi:hypothetical protein
MFNGYFDDKSECLFGITAKKIHQTPVYTGMTALGICLPNPVIESATRTLVKAIGNARILEVGCGAGLTTIGGMNCGHLTQSFCRSGTIRTK